jgi:hypothetical protein
MCRFVWAPDKEAEMNVRYRIELSQAEREALTTMLSGGKHAARKLKRAQILPAADAGSSDDEIACTVAVGGSTVYRTRPQPRVPSSTRAADRRRIPRPACDPLAGRADTA